MTAYTTIPGQPHCDTGLVGPKLLKPVKKKKGGFPGGSVMRTFGFDFSKLMYDLQAKAAGPAGAQQGQLVSLAMMGLQMGMGVLQGMMGAILDIVPPLIPPPVSCMFICVFRFGPRQFGSLGCLQCALQISHVGGARDLAPTYTCSGLDQHTFALPPHAHGQ